MNTPEDVFVPLTQELSESLAELHVSMPELLRAFNDVGHAAMRPGSLDRKTKELLALALGVSTRCDPCIAFHARSLAKLGATLAEVDEMLGVTVHMGGSPSLMYALHARTAFQEFLQLHSPHGQAAQP